MEEVCSRFPSLSEKIFDSLDNKSIACCTKVSKSWHSYLKNKKIVEIRIIKSIIKEFGISGQAWQDVFDKGSSNTIIDLRHVVEDRINFGVKDLTPLHVAAYSGQMDLYKNISEMSSEKYPKDDKGQVPLLYAAFCGHLEICKHIMRDIENKNPTSNNGNTPLHFAAANGYIKTCKIIMEHLKNKNPINNVGWTPLHSASQKGYINICELILESLDNKNPVDDKGWTPLHAAAEGGHDKICGLILESLENKNPADNDGWTPLHCAAEKGHYELCKLIIDEVGDKNLANYYMVITNSNLRFFLFLGYIVINLPICPSWLYKLIVVCLYVCWLL